MQNKPDKNQQLAQELMKKLNPEEKKKLDNILADKAATQKILNTPEAQKLLKELLGGK
jgi:F0F1-type ATP synthase assembly protein I